MLIATVITILIPGTCSKAKCINPYISNMLDNIKIETIIKTGKNLEKKMNIAHIQM